MSNLHQLTQFSLKTFNTFEKQNKTKMSSYKNQQQNLFKWNKQINNDQFQTNV